MTLRDVTVRSEYRTFIDNIVDDFYIPLLSRAVFYRRAVGFFSSSVLVQIADGIRQLAENDGHIQIVASPNLSDEDIVAIKHGYKLRDEIVRNVVLRELRGAQNEFEKQQLNLLANLVASGMLDIKIAFTENENRLGMYHEKMGIISDAWGNVVAFSGSMNETQTALSLNYETIDVFCSWKGDDAAERVNNKQAAFTAIWNDTEPNIRIIPFPDLKDEFIRRYRVTDEGFDEEEKGYGAGIIKEDVGDERQPRIPKIPATVKLHDYQIEAIDNWEQNEFRGIFDMATGTGKTFTGLGAVVRLCEKLNGRLAVFIVAPFQHLVEQWVEDIERFGITPIIGYSVSSQKNWFHRLDNAVRDQKLDVKNREFFCFICTNATFSASRVQRVLERIHGDVLLLVDEAHNFGAERLRKLMSERYAYRLALSATIDRHNDEEGTKKICDYFGAKCIEYPLERAINENKLTPYKYYPVITTLNDEERRIYTDLTH